MFETKNYWGLSNVFQRVFTFILASSLPVATNVPSGLKHPDLHGPLCDVT